MLICLRLRGSGEQDVINSDCVRGEDDALLSPLFALDLDGDLFGTALVATHTIYTLHSHYEVFVRLHGRVHRLKNKEPKDLF